MRLFSLLFVAVLIPAFPGLTLAQSGGEPPSLLAVTEAITTFQQDPLSGEGVNAATIILQFAERSDQVEVSLYRPVFPWLGTDAYPPYSDLLTTAYVAGDIQAQLASGTKGEQTLPSVSMTLRIYEKIKAQDKDYSLPVMETLLDAEKKGTLKELLKLP